MKINTMPVVYCRAGGVSGAFIAAGIQLHSVLKYFVADRKSKNLNINFVNRCRCTNLVLTFETSVGIHNIITEDSVFAAVG